ncbi:MAG: sugar-binding transcriptional regulator [Bacillota bacterium]
MNELIQLQIKLVPEIIDITEKRYSILRTVEFNQPIGRRALAANLNKSERWVRSELDFLKDQGLIDIQPLGMTITDEGKSLIGKLREYIAELKGLKNLEQYIKDTLGIMDVVIVPGDADHEREAVSEIAKAAFEYVKRRLRNNSVIAVSGGYTLLAVAEQSYKVDAKNLVVVPARGGIKADLERQANIVAAKMAKNIGGDYYLLHLPDNIDAEMLERMSADPDIAKVMKYIKSSDIFIFGLSSLEAISKKRNFTTEEMRHLESLAVKAEAFGCYFDINGNIVHKSSSIGITDSDLNNIDTVMAVGGGVSKAQPLILVNKGRSNNVIITDEAAAREIYNILRGGN